MPASCPTRYSCNALVHWNVLCSTQDNRFRALAEDWQRDGKHFAGLIFGLQVRGTIGDYVRDLELIAKASDPSDWHEQIEFIPY